MSKISKKSSTQFIPKSYSRPGLTQQQICQIKQAFDLFDMDGQGTIDPNELKAVMSSLGPQSKNHSIYQMISDLDADGKGQINFNQFLQLMISRVTDKDTKQNINKIFHLFDDDKQGYISIKNLRRVAKELGQTIDDSDLQEMIQRADTDNDSLVSLEQFYHIMTKKTFAA